MGFVSPRPRETRRVSGKQNSLLRLVPVISACLVPPPLAQASHTIFMLEAVRDKPVVQLSERPKAPYRRQARRDRSRVRIVIAQEL